jgi:hypothetical protein
MGSLSTVSEPRHVGCVCSDQTQHLDLFQRHPAMGWPPQNAADTDVEAGDTQPFRLNRTAAPLKEHPPLPQPCRKVGSCRSEQNRVGAQAKAPGIGTRAETHSWQQGPPERLKQSVCKEVGNLKSYAHLTSPTSP